MCVCDMIYSGDCFGASRCTRIAIATTTITITDEQHSLFVNSLVTIFNPATQRIAENVVASKHSSIKTNFFCSGCWVIFAPGYQHILLVLLGKGVTEVNALQLFKHLWSTIDIYWTPYLQCHCLHYNTPSSCSAYCQIVLMIFNQDFLSVTNYASCKQKRIVKCLQSNNALY